MNAHVEWFNLSIQEEFSDHHEELLVRPNQFNRELIIWYNAEGPDCALKLKSPVEFLLKQDPALCKT
jgi:hypothetical protein